MEGVRQSRSGMWQAGQLSSLYEQMCLSSEGHCHVGNVAKSLAFSREAKNNGFLK